MADDDDDDKEPTDKNKVPREIRAVMHEENQNQLFLIIKAIKYWVTAAVALIGIGVAAKAFVDRYQLVADAERLAKHQDEVAKTVGNHEIRLDVHDIRFANTKEQLDRIEGQSDWQTRTQYQVAKKILKAPNGAPPTKKILPPPPPPQRVAAAPKDGGARPGDMK